MIPIKSGDFNRRVMFQTRSQTVDSLGGQSVSWVDAFLAWALIEPASASERLLANQTRVEVSHKITTRYRAEFANPVSVGAMRVSYSGRFFNLSGSANIDERNRIVQIASSEGLSNG